MSLPEYGVNDSGDGDAVRFEPGDAGYDDGMAVERCPDGPRVDGESRVTIIPPAFEVPDGSGGASSAMDQVRSNVADSIDGGTAGFVHGTCSKFKKDPCGDGCV